MTIQLSADVSWCQADDAMILLHARTGRYWQLNETGSSILRSLLEGRPTTEIAASLASTTTADAVEIATDVDRLVAQLRRARLVENDGPR